MKKSRQRRSRTDRHKARAKPQIERAPIRTPFAIQPHALFWIGIIATSFTLFSNLQTVLDLSKWTHFLTSQWLSFIEWLWQFPYRLLGLTPVKEVAVTMTLYSFLIIISISALALEFKHEAPPKRAPLTRNKSAFRQSLETMLSHEYNIAIMRGCIGGTLALIAYGILVNTLIFQEHAIDLFSKFRWYHYSFPALGAISSIALIRDGHQKELALTAVAGLGLAIIFFALSFPAAIAASHKGKEEIARFQELVLLLNMVMMPYKTGILIAIAKPYYLIIRLSLVIVILAVLIALNVLATSGFNLQPPRL